MKLFRLTLILLLSLIITNCSTDNADNPEDEMEIEADESAAIVRDFIGEECFSVLEELNFDINGGSNIPEVEGIFVINPIMVDASGDNSNFDFDSEGELENGLPFAIQNLQSDGSFDFTFIFFEERITEPLWLGNGNDFSLFFSIVFEELPELSTIYGITGTITADGIENGQFLICETTTEATGGLLFFDGDDLFEFLDN